MTPQKIVVVILAGLSAVCEIWGTITVWIAYNRSANVGDSIRREMRQAKIDELPRLMESKDDFVRMMARFADPSEVQVVREQNRKAVLTLSHPLRKSRSMTAGLAAYILGAIFGLGAVIAGVLW